MPDIIDTGHSVMATFWHILKPEDKLKLAGLYRELAGFPFVPPDMPGRAVQCEPQLESPQEIDKLMRQKPKRII